MSQHSGVSYGKMYPSSPVIIAPEDEDAVGALVYTSS
jgi:hypothetical protein